MQEKFKSLLKDDRVFMVSVVVLVAVAGFALGRYSALPGSALWGQGGVAVGPATVGVAYTSGVLGAAAGSGTAAVVQPLSAAIEPVAPEEAVVTGPYVASRSGTKYHHESCGGAKQIKAENKIFFPTETAARAAGYLPAANCKILTPYSP